MRKLYKPMSCPVCGNQCCTREDKTYTCEVCAEQWEMVTPVGPAHKMLHRIKYLVQQAMCGGDMVMEETWVGVPVDKLKELKELLHILGEYL